MASVPGGMARRQGDLACRATPRPHARDDPGLGRRAASAGDRSRRPRFVPPARHRAVPWRDAASRVARRSSPRPRLDQSSPATRQSRRTRPSQKRSPPCTLASSKSTPSSMATDARAASCSILYSSGSDTHRQSSTRAIVPATSPHSDVPIKTTWDLSPNSSRERFSTISTSSSCQRLPDQPDWFRCRRLLPASSPPMLSGSPPSADASKLRKLRTALGVAHERGSTST